MHDTRKSCSVKSFAAHHDIDEYNSNHMASSCATAGTPSATVCTKVSTTELCAVQLLHALGRKCRLRQRVVCAASLYLHRAGFGPPAQLPLTLAAALWMASKAEESPASPGTLLDGLAKLGYGGCGGGELGGSGPLGAADLVRVECRLIEALGFDLTTPAHPQLHIAKLALAAGADCSAECVATAHALANDCCRFALPLRHPPRVLAAACLYAAGAAHRLPAAQQWLERSVEARELPAVEAAVAALCGAYARCASLQPADFASAQLPPAGRRARRHNQPPPPPPRGGVPAAAADKAVAGVKRKAAA